MTELVGVVIAAEALSHRADWGTADPAVDGAVQVVVAANGKQYVFLFHVEIARHYPVGTRVYVGLRAAHDVDRP